MHTNDPCGVVVQWQCSRNIKHFTLDLTKQNPKQKPRSHSTSLSLCRSLSFSARLVEKLFKGVVLVLKINFFDNTARRRIKPL